MDVETEERKDVLLTEDIDSGKLKVVAGLNDNGTLKTVFPKQENEPDFMKIDKHGNMLENFFLNYFAQAKNPRHTGFYMVAKDGIEGISGIISELLQNGGKEGEEFLKDYKIDTSKYERQDVDMTHSTEENNNPPEQKHEYQPLNKEMIDWDAFSKIGIAQESLEKSGSLDDMLNYRRSSNLHNISMKVDDIILNTDARLSLRKVDDGRIIPVIHAVRKAPELDRPFYGNTFTAMDKENLINTGHLGRTIELNIKGLDKTIRSFVSVDPKTNELVAYSTKNVSIPNKIKGVTLDDNQRCDLMEGRSIYIKGMTAKSGKLFNASVQVSGSERGLIFMYDRQQNQSQNQSQSLDGVRIPNKLGGVQLSEEQRSNLKQGEVIYVENLVDKKGQVYNAYVKVNNEKGKLDFYKWDPRKKQVQKNNNTETQPKQNRTKMKR